MSSAEVDAYLDQLDEPARSTLQDLRATILAIVPEAEECISYSMPGFRVRGQVVAGFAAFTTHVSYFPHSGSVLGQLPDEIAAANCTATTKSTLQFPADAPLPRSLVEKLLAVKINQTFPDAS